MRSKYDIQTAHYTEADVYLEAADVAAINAAIADSNASGALGMLLYEEASGGESFDYDVRKDALVSLTEHESDDDDDEGGGGPT